MYLAIWVFCSYIQRSLGYYITLSNIYVDKGAFKRKELWGKIILLEHVQQKRRQSRGALALSMQIWHPSYILGNR